LLLVLLTAFLYAAAPAPSPLSPNTGYGLVRIAISGNEAARAVTARKLGDSGDVSFLAALTDALFFLHADERGPMLAALRKLAGEDPGPRYHDWVELVGRRTDITPAAGYLDWKGSLFARIDQHYKAVLAAGAPTLVRPEEILWGGVRWDAIPALDEPPHVAAAAERDLDDRERVFGLSAGGERRAYPLRYLSWHELFNDTVGGQPVAVTYSALCGSGIAWSTKNPAGGRHTFGTSGLLYRSDKLMFDRATQTLWLQMTGEPVLGPLAANPEPLVMLPMTATTWGAWKGLHPDTTVLKLSAAFGARWGYRYTPGAADLARDGVSFPIWNKSRLLEHSEIVFGLRLRDRTKAWPVARVTAQKVVNDRLGDTDLVLLGDADSSSIRAYRRDGHTFRPGPEAGNVLDEASHLWRITEENLAPPAATSEKPLPRLPGHAAYWFAWYGFHPQTEVWLR
jgi:hypothetical protein